MRVDRRVCSLIEIQGIACDAVCEIVLSRPAGKVRHKLDVRICIDIVASAFDHQRIAVKNEIRMIPLTFCSEERVERHTAGVVIRVIVVIGNDAFPFHVEIVLQILAVPAHQKHTQGC